MCEKTQGSIYVIGKESRVSTLTRHKQVTMVQYLINNFEGTEVLFMSVLGGSMRYHPIFLRKKRKNNVYLTHGGARQLAI